MDHGPCCHVESMRVNMNHDKSVYFKSGDFSNLIDQSLINLSLFPALPKNCRKGNYFLVCKIVLSKKCQNLDRSRRPLVLLDLDLDLLLLLLDRDRLLFFFVLDLQIIIFIEF